MKNLSLGLDFGTSGARAIVIDVAQEMQYELQYSFETTVKEKETDIATNWRTALFTLIEQIPQKQRQEIVSISFDGTSSTVLICDAVGQPVEQPLMYNDGRGIEVMETLKTLAPQNNIVLSATSSFAKLLWFIQNLKLKLKTNYYFLHQADWLGFLLHGQIGITDYHNALKLGYNVEKLCYPKWLKNIQIPIHLPKVVAPGTPIAEVLPDVAKMLGLRANCVVCAGTTDSIAAFLGSDAKYPGEAVTSLGSTLVIKLLSRTRVDDCRYGIYSHRLGDFWLVGGASNTGGAVLRHFFSDTELESLSHRIEAERESLLDYYPLLKPGDRFPVNDPYLPPRIEPKPANSVDFLHGLLEGMARIEAQAYKLLQQLGATPLTCVYTAGGGAKNSAWATIRGRHLQVPILPSNNTNAAYGTALLAMQGYNKKFS